MGALIAGAAILLLLCAIAAPFEYAIRRSPGFARALDRLVVRVLGE